MPEVTKAKFADVCPATAPGRLYLKGGDDQGAPLSDFTDQELTQYATALGQALVARAGDQRKALAAAEAAAAK